MIMGTGYAKVPEAVTSYAKAAPSAGGRNDIRDIAYPPYRDAAVVLGAAQVGAPDPDHGDRDDQDEQCDPGGDEEGPVEAGRQRAGVGEQQAEPGPGHQHRAEQPARVSAVLGDPGQPVRAPGARGPAGQQQRAGADARHERGGGEGGGQQHGGERQEGHARLERGVTPYVLHEQVDEEEDPEESGPYA